MSNESNYSKRSFPANLVEGREHWSDRDDLVSGNFYYVVDKKGRKVGLVSCLPNAGDKGSAWGVTMFCGSGNKPEWTWDGNVERPTLSPSIHRVGHWHGWLRNGLFESVRSK